MIHMYTYACLRMFIKRLNMYICIYTSVCVASNKRAETFYPKKHVGCNFCEIGRVDGGNAMSEIGKPPSSFAINLLSRMLRACRMKSHCDASASMLISMVRATPQGLTNVQSVPCSMPSQLMRTTFGVNLHWETCSVLTLEHRANGFKRERVGEPPRLYLHADDEEHAWYITILWFYM